MPEIKARDEEVVKMLSLIFLPLELALEFILLPVRIMSAMFRTSRWIAIVMIAGACSVLSGIVSALAGSLQNLLPWILIAVGIFLIVRANHSHPEVREEAFESFYARKSAE